MEAQEQDKPQKIQRKRIKCPICEENILEEVFKMHHARCQFLNTLKQYRQASYRSTFQRRRQHMGRHQRNSDDSDEQSEKGDNRQNEQSERQKMEQAYAILMAKTQQVEQENQKQRRKMYSIDVNNKSYHQCKYCRRRVRLRIHEQKCQKRYNFCPFCAEQFTQQTMDAHLDDCDERCRVKRIQLLMGESSSEQNSRSFDRASSSEEEQQFVANREDIYQVNPYSRNQSNELRNPNFIYSHTPPIQGSPYYSIDVIGMPRPLYRYRRQFYPRRRQQPQAEADPQRQKRVVEALIRYGYDVQQIQKLKGHRKYHHYLRLIERYMEQGDDPFSEGMSEYQISHLQCKKYQKKMEEQQQDDMCAICYSAFEKGDELMQLKCNHYFHDYCVRQWLQVNFRCPVCKFHQVSRKITLN